MTGDLHCMIFVMEDNLGEAESFALALTAMSGSRHSIEPRALCAIADRLTQTLADLRQQWQQVFDASKAGGAA